MAATDLRKLVTITGFLPSEGEDVLLLTSVATIPLKPKASYLKFNHSSDMSVFLNPKQSLHKHFT